jgi:hypothetical protein
VNRPFGVDGSENVEVNDGDVSGGETSMSRVCRMLGVSGVLGDSGITPACMGWNITWSVGDAWTFRVAFCLHTGTFPQQGKLGVR